MIALTREEHTTKVYLETTGEIWFADATETPQRFDGSIEDFTQRCRHRRGVVRILGTQASSSFLAHAYPPDQEGQIRFELASPRICLSGEERADPHMAVYRMRQCTLPASLGGWHRMLDADYMAYWLAYVVARGDHRAIDRAIRKHPAWTAVSFVAGVDCQAASQVLSAVLDPRWHIDPGRPERLSRLRFYLGLNPWVLNLALHETFRASPVLARCRAVLQTWSSGGCPHERDLSAPNQFLWRIFCKAGGGQRGELIASQFLISFLRHAWLQALTTTRCGQESLFLPELLLREHGELHAYREHCRRQQETI